MVHAATAIYLAPVAALTNMDWAAGATTIMLTGEGSGLRCRTNCLRPPHDLTPEPSPPRWRRQEP